MEGRAFKSRWHGRLARASSSGLFTTEAPIAPTIDRAQVVRGTDPQLIIFLRVFVTSRFIRFFSGQPNKCTGETPMPPDFFPFDYFKSPGKFSLC